MSLVAHAKQELERIHGDPELIVCYLEVVSAFAAKSAEGLDPDVLVALFKHHHVAPITNDPAEWYRVDTNIWQNLRDRRVLSDDGGQTYHVILDESEDDGSVPQRRVSEPMKGRTT